MALSAFVPLPAMASDGHSGGKATPSKTSLRQAMAQEAAHTPLRASSARSAAQNNPSKQSTAFFRSPVGLAALAIVVIGSGYAVYSASHDKITSPAKK